MTKRSIISSLLFLVILFITGCSSGGGSVTNSTLVVEPEIVVQNMIAQWHSSSNGPVFSADTNGKPIVVSSTRPSEESLGIIKFDLFGETWELRVDKVEYTGDDKAIVHTTYAKRSETSGGLTTLFYLYKEDSHWFVYEISVVELPSVISSSGVIEGFITNEVNDAAVPEARVEAYLENSQVLAGSAVTATNGFYKISDLQPGAYYLVIDREGYSPYTKTGIIVN